MAVQAFILLFVALSPCMDTPLGAVQVAAKEVAVTVSFKSCSAVLTDDAVVVA